MEFVKIECCCTECGKTFEHIKECRTRIEANRYEKWAKRNKNLCTDCYKAQKQKEAQALAVAMNLPELTGRSEKQISFAFRLRNNYIEKNEKLIEKAQAHLQKINPSRIKVVAENNDMSEKDCLLEAFDRIGLLKAYICLTADSAQEIIDFLR